MDKRSLFAAIQIALVVGTVLNIINQYQPLLALDFKNIAPGKFSLNYLVPFLVSLYSSLATERRNRSR